MGPVILYITLRGHVSNPTKGELGRKTKINLTFSLKLRGHGTLRESEMGRKGNPRSKQESSPSFSVRPRHAMTSEYREEGSRRNKAEWIGLQRFHAEGISQGGERRRKVTRLRRAARKKNLY